MHKFLALEGIYEGAAQRGVKTKIEDDMVESYRYTVYGLNPAWIRKTICARKALEGTF